MVMVINRSKSFKFGQQNAWRRLQQQGTSWIDWIVA
jgi:hypothetical protein